MQRPIFSYVKEKGGNGGIAELLQLTDDEELPFGKVICWQLSKGELTNFERLYYEYDPAEIYELLAIELSLSYGENRTNS